MCWSMKLSFAVLANFYYHAFLRIFYCFFRVFLDPRQLENLGDDFGATVVVTQLSLNYKYLVWTLNFRRFFTFFHRIFNFQTTDCPVLLPPTLEEMTP